MDFGTDRIADLKRTQDVRRKDLRTFHHIMVFLAVTTVLTGGALVPWHGAVKLDIEQARRIGSAFLAAGIADTLILYFWDRIFGKDA